MRRLLRDRNARWYLGGQTLSIYGDTALWLAAGIWVKELTGSNGAAGLAFFFFALPALLSPLAGLVVDRVRRRPLLIWANLATAAAVLSLLAVHSRHDVWIVYFVMFLYGLSFGFLGSGQSALLTVMLPDDLLVDANGMLRTVREAMRLVGPLTGAGLFAAFGGGTVAVLDAATFVVAAASLAFVRVDEQAPAPSEMHWLREVTAGIEHVWQTVVLRQMVITLCLALFVVGFIESIGFAVVSQGLHRPPSFLGVLIAIQGVGALVGGPTSAPLVRRIGEGPATGLGLLLFAVAAAMLVSSSMAMVVGGLILLGISLPWVIVGFNTLIQRRTPAHLQGRAFAAADTIASLPQTFSIALGAALISAVSYRLLLLVISAVVTLSAAYLLTRKEQWERPVEVAVDTAEAEGADEAPIG